MPGHDGRMLSRVLRFDALTCAAMGVALLAGATPAGELLGLGPAVLRGAAAVLLPFAALLAWAARQDRPPALVLRAIVAGNLLWVVASVLLAVGATSLTTLGTAFVLAQAAVVLVIADLELVGARRLRAATA